MFFKDCGSNPNRCNGSHLTKRVIRKPNWAFKTLFEGPNHTQVDELPH